MDPAKDYYHILKVSPGAGAQELLRAKRVLLHRYHPDHNPKRPEWAAERTRLVLEAFQVLSDPELRRRYEEERRRWLAKQSRRSSASPSSERRSAPTDNARSRIRPEEPLPPGLRWAHCSCCGRYSRLPEDMPLTQVRCGACGEPLELSARERWRRRLWAWDARLERWRLALLRPFRRSGPR